NGAAELAGLESIKKSAFLDDSASRNIDEDGVTIHHCNLSRANETVGPRKKWSGNNKHIASVQSFVQLIWPQHAIDERRRGQIKATADACHTHPKRVGAPSDLFADCSEAKYSHVSVVDAPRPGIARQFVLNPSPILLGRHH